MKNFRIIKHLSKIFTDGKLEEVKKFHISRKALKSYLLKRYPSKLVSKILKYFEFSNSQVSLEEIVEKMGTLYEANHVDKY